MSSMISTASMQANKIQMKTGYSLVYNIIKIKKATPMFDKLNEDGKKEALKRIEELTEISKYTNKENNQIAIAAHNDDNTKEQLKLMQQDVDEL